MLQDARCVLSVQVLDEWNWECCLLPCMHQVCVTLLLDTFLACLFTMVYMAQARLEHVYQCGVIRLTLFGSDSSSCTYYDWCGHNPDQNTRAT